MISGHWYRIPDMLLRDERMTRADIACFAVIADKADGASVQLTRAEIAAQAGCSVISVARAVKKLSDMRYISVEHTKGEASNYTQLLLEPKRRGGKRSAAKLDDNVSKYEVCINHFEEVSK